MSYKLEKVGFSKACEKIPEYKYVLLYMISEVILDKTESLSEINWAECTEARFFQRIRNYISLIWMERCRQLLFLMKMAMMSW